MTLLVAWFLQGALLLTLLLGGGDGAESGGVSYALFRFALVGACCYLFCCGVFLLALGKYFWGIISGRKQSRVARRFARWSLLTLGLLLVVELLGAFGT